MTDRPPEPHSKAMLGVSPVSPDAPAPTADRESIPPFENVYETYFPYVWRSVQRLGVSDGAVDDVVQEVFMVVHRRLAEFEGRSTLKTWLYGIALRVARAHRAKSRASREAPPAAIDHVRAPDSSRPDAHAENAEAARVVNALLASLDEDQREVFVLAELEELPAPEIAEALDVKLNTVYSRLRLARAAFAEAAARYRAKDGWRTT